MVNARLFLNRMRSMVLRRLLVALCTIIQLLITRAVVAETVIPHNSIVSGWLIILILLNGLSETAYKGALIEI